MRPAVIGLAGGVGSGKSTVARAFERLGCLVSDSDAGVRELLARGEVIERLRSWWGDGVVAPDGAADRRAIAAIVFGDDAERLRLEALLHPMLRATREALIERAAREGAPGVIIDAPLLFEVGLDAECDAVVFVRVPREVRLARVASGRGWDEGELARREAAQIPVEEKRRRSDHEIDNSTDTGALDSAARRILAQVRQGLHSISDG
ncbi:MAG: dephospho-CoA kinase [Planctomycetota bacterium]